MKKMTKEQLIKDILEQEYDAYDGEWDYVEALLKYGCKGLENMTTEELKALHYDGKNITIVKQVEVEE